ncbi:tetratricopeptide repeat protein [Streptomyces sp. NPDC007205]|uniref:tetratricopeptide repeat protein n=1 Tax=Streptomyces sp. NPDC007205 TaxID=3154316 RepID=UPI0033F75C42
MVGGPDEPEAALTELRQLLEDALAREGLTKIQLAARTGLARTTIQTAFQPGGPVPSAATVAALAGKLGLPDEQMLELRRTAAGEVGPVRVRDEGLGKPIGQWDPHDLEVHPAGTATAAAHSGARAQRALPGYVRRAHDQILAEAVGEASAGRSRMLVLVGSSSTGKTRACWEAVQPLTAEGWRLWHPHDPTRAEAALADLDRVAPRTVVWLNEAQHYLGHPHVGERIAAALHTLLTHVARGPVLVLGTLWPEYANSYTALPNPGQADPHSRVRELLTGRTLTVPDAFDEKAIHAASILARGGDRFMEDALTRAHAHGRVTQDLAGAPELMRRYEHGTPPVRALLQAAMDARRLGVGLHLPQAFLIVAATDYLTDDDYDQLTEDWAERAFADLARPVHGKQVPLRRTATRPPRVPAPTVTPVPASGPVFRLADYLEQHGRTTRRRLCPPASFWHAAHTHLTDPDDLHTLATAADHRQRLQWAHHLWRKVANAGHPGALLNLAQMRALAGDSESVETLYRQAADADHPDALLRLAWWRERAGDLESAEALYRRAADVGGPTGLTSLAQMRALAGDLESAETLYRQAADDGEPFALFKIAEMSERAGNLESAEALYRQAADAGYFGALLSLARMRERAGDLESAETLYDQAAGGPRALTYMAWKRQQSGRSESVETYFLQAADAGNTAAMIALARMREHVGDRQGAETLYWQAAEAGDGNAPPNLVRLREQAEDPGGAEALARQAADAGWPYALYSLARMREQAGDQESADALARQAADAGETVLSFQRWWPYGLDPDGSPTPPWPADSSP